MTLLQSGGGRRQSSPSLTDPRPSAGQPRFMAVRGRRAPEDDQGEIRDEEGHWLKPGARMRAAAAPHSTVLLKRPSLHSHHQYRPRPITDIISFAIITMDPQTFLNFALRAAAPFPSWSQYYSTPQPKISSSFLIENILGLNRNNRNNFQPRSWRAARC